MSNVLFVCMDNSGLSQMAEAFFNRLAKGKGKAKSAGVQPAERLDDNVIEIMWEVGIEISRQRTKQLTPELLKWANRVIIFGPEGKRVRSKELLKCENWVIEDTAGKSVDSLRRIRAEIQARVAQLATDISSTITRTGFNEDNS